MSRLTRWQLDNCILLFIFHFSIMFLLFRYLIYLGYCLLTVIVNY